MLKGTGKAVKIFTAGLVTAAIGIAASLTLSLLPGGGVESLSLTYPVNAEDSYAAAENLKIEDLPTATCDVCGGKAYLIGTETELATVMRHAQDTVGETVPGLSYCYKVGEELARRSVDLTSWGAYQIGTAEAAPFTGHFDFSGLTVKVKASAAGLFPYVGKNAETDKIGYVKDLTVYQDGNGPVVSSVLSGGGVIDGIKAYPVYSGTVKANGFGGLVWRIGKIAENSSDFQLDAQAVGTLKNSSITMSTKGNAAVTYQNYGALVYQCAGLVENCHARYSDSDETYNTAGGLTHNAMGNAIIRNCSNTIPSNGVKTNMSGYFGGIDLGSYTGITIQNCSVKMGTVRTSYASNRGHSYTGGITGRVVRNAYSGKSIKMTVQNCRVEGDALYGGYHSGGIIGQVTNDGAGTNVDIINCYVRLNTLQGYYDTGGLIGDVDGKSTACSIKLHNNTVVIDKFESTMTTSWPSMGGFVSYFWGNNLQAEIKNCNGYFGSFRGVNANSVMKCSPIVGLLGSNFASSTPSTLTISDTFVRLTDGKIENVVYAGAIIGGIMRKNSGWTLSVDRISYNKAYQKDGVTYYPQITEELGYIENTAAAWTYQRGTKVYDANAAGTPADYIMPETPPETIMQPAAGYESQQRSKLTATENGGMLTLKLNLKSAYAGYTLDALYYSLLGGTWNSDTQLVYQGKVCGNVGGGYAIGSAVSPAGEVLLKVPAAGYAQTKLCVKVRLVKGADVQWVTLYGDGGVAENL